MPFRAQRLVAFLALHGRQPRCVVAGGLWPDSTERRAQSSLRTTSVHVRNLAPGLLTSSRDPLGLDTFTIDVGVWQRGPGDVVAEPTSEAVDDLITGGELLPGWYEDWVVFERERWRHRRLLALERVVQRLLEAGDSALALASAEACVELEPLRESSHRALAMAHLAAGNRLEALRAYESFRRRSLSEFGLAPDPRFTQLVAPLLREQGERRLAHSG